MYEFYKDQPGSKKLKKSRKELKKLYKQIPETSGCLENINKEDGCGGWCCSRMSPQLMYVEFLNIWNHVLTNYPAEKIASLLLKSVHLYLNGLPTKGCLFWDKNTRLCGCHSHRPLNCRIYAQTPEEEFRPRFERLKILYADQPDAYIRDQCNLCKTLGNKPTKADTDAWQLYLEQIEESIGIDKKLISDAPGGSYRAPHDHVLLRLCSQSFLSELTAVKVSGTKSEKEQYVANLVKKMQKQYPNFKDECAETKNKSPATETV